MARPQAAASSQGRSVGWRVRSGDCGINRSSLFCCPELRALSLTCSALRGKGHFDVLSAPECLRFPPVPLVCFSTQAWEWGGRVRSRAHNLHTGRVRSRYGPLIVIFGDVKIFWNLKFPACRVGTALLRTLVGTHELTQVKIHSAAFPVAKNRGWLTSLYRDRS